MKNEKKNQDVSKITSLVSIFITILDVTNRLLSENNIKRERSRHLKNLLKEIAESEFRNYDGSNSLGLKDNDAIKIIDKLDQMIKELISYKENGRKKHLSNIQEKSDSYMESIFEIITLVY